MKNLWYRLLGRLLTSLYYHRVRLINPRSLPSNGPVLFVALHRNGAVDGYVYKSVIPRANFLISVQLRRSLLGRLFFSGFEVARSKDRTPTDARPASADSAALQACADYVRQGGALVVMPEGSSDLGHRHLPFHKGAARILAQLVVQPDLPVRVIPLGIHYERAWAWQSDVEVVVGEPIDIGLPADSPPAGRIDLLHERIVRALESLAVQAGSADIFSERERIAYASTLGSKRSYFAALKALESGMPEVAALFSKMEEEISATAGGRRLWRHQGVPLVPMASAWAYPPLWATLLPVFALALLCNAVPLACAWWAGKRFSDGRNTIALWRLLVGFPCLLLWASALLVAAIWLHSLPLWFAYVAISVLGLRLVRRVQKLTISLHNWIIAPALRAPLLRWRESLESCMRGSDV